MELINNNILYNNLSYSRILIGVLAYDLLEDRRTELMTTDFLNFEFEPITILC